MVLGYSMVESIKVWTQRIYRRVVTNYKPMKNLSL